MYCALIFSYCICSIGLGVGILEICDVSVLFKVRKIGNVNDPWEEEGKKEEVDDADEAVRAAGKGDTVDEWCTSEGPCSKYSCAWTFKLLVR